MAAHIALHETGASFESRPLSFANKEQRRPEYLALNPEGKVPTLLVDGRPLTEVAAILFYLAKRYPEAQLLPANDLAAEAQAISWMSFIASTIHPARREGLEHAKKVYGIADKRLGANAWALLAMSDGATMTVRSETEMRLDNYRYAPDGDASENSVAVRGTGDPSRNTSCRSSSRTMSAKRRTEPGARPFARRMIAWARATISARLNGFVT